MRHMNAVSCIFYPVYSLIFDIGSVLGGEKVDFDDFFFWLQKRWSFGIERKRKDEFLMDFYCCRRN